MDLDAFFHRVPIAGYPISVLVRLPDATRSAALQDDIVRLLAGRSGGDEAVVVTAGPVPENLPIRKAGIRFRFLVRLDPYSGPALADGLLACRHPAIVTVDPDVSISPAKLADLLGLLDAVEPSHAPPEPERSRLRRGLLGWATMPFRLVAWLIGRLLESPEEPGVANEPTLGADLVVGRRTGNSRYFTWPIERLVRAIFAVPVTDPSCPIKAIRSAAVRGIELQAHGPLVEFELAAKMTFLTCLVDELEMAPTPTRESLLSILWSQRRELWRLFAKPKFWKWDPARARLRPSLDQAPVVVVAAHRKPPTQAISIAKFDRPPWGPRFPRHSLRRPAGAHC